MLFHNVFVFATFWMHKDIVCGDSTDLGITIPGGWGAAGAPNDGWHQHLHTLNRAFCTASVGWVNSVDVRKQLDALSLSVQGSLSTKLLGPSIACFLVSFAVTYIYIYLCVRLRVWREINTKCTAAFYMHVPLQYGEYEVVRLDSFARGCLRS